MEIEKKETRLKVLLGTNTAKVTLRSGSEINLYPLRLTDLADLEDKLGMSMTEVFGQSKTFKINHLILILWLSVRRDGLTKEQISKQQWKVTERDVGEWFDFSDVGELIDVMQAVFSLSGLEMQLKNGESQFNQPQQSELPLNPGK